MFVACRRLQVDALEFHLVISEVLSKYGMQLSVAQVRDTPPLPPLEGLSLQVGSCT
jgi:hypothetical protein